MKITIDVENTTKNISIAIDPDGMEPGPFNEDINTLLYYLVHPSSSLFLFLIEDLKKNYPEIFLNYINYLKSQEPVVAPENVLR